VLRPSEEPLSDRYDLAVLDLDGVVYVGRQVVPGADAALRVAREHGMRRAFVTNNAARTPAVVAAHLTALGVDAAAADVVTSAQAAARLVAASVPAGGRVYVIGGDGLEEALRERGFRPVTSPDDGRDDGAGDGASDRAGQPVAAVVQGYGPAMPWRQVVDGAILVRAGLPWVASNTDLTLPPDRGIGPGNGTLVKLVADFAGRSPQVAGKPEPALFEETLDRVGGRRPLVVGDRLDTDIEGAKRLGWPSLLVLTGVTGLAELVAAPPGQRPTYLGPDLATLNRPHPVPEVHGAEHRLGGWTARVDDGRLRVTGNGASPADWWRVVASAAWAHGDDTGAAPDVAGLVVPGGA
jgi:HAD superfamily hydrolase (TIGR01450 family)